jgi:hypothetical protein
MGVFVMSTLVGASLSSDFFPQPGMARARHVLLNTDRKNIPIFLNLLFKIIPLKNYSFGLTKLLKVFEMWNFAKP